MKKIAFRLTIGLLALVAAGGLLHRSAGFIVDHVLTCPASCRWDRVKGYQGCAPLTAHLEIKTTPDPKNHGTAVWYRAVVRNQSCETIKLLPEFYMQNENSYGAIRNRSGSRIVVTDGAGRELDPDFGRSEALDMAASEEEIHPYAHDTSLLHPLIETVEGPGYALDYIKLKPGSTIVASPTLLAPYRMALRTVEADRFVGTSAFPEAVADPGVRSRYAVPPAGFRRLTEFALSRKGTYTAQFKIGGPVAVQNYFDVGSPIYRGIRRLLYFAAAPNNPRGRRTVIADVVSEKVPFEVP